MKALRRRAAAAPYRRTASTLWLGLGLALGASAADVPELPEGLAAPATEAAAAETPRAEAAGTEPPAGPALPAGLGELSTGSEGAADDDAPSLPLGLGESPSGDVSIAAAPSSRGALAERLDGFVETRLGTRVVDDPYQGDASIAELRTQLASQWNPGPVTLRIVGDLVLDGVEPDRSVDLETGRGWVDLREANLVFRPLSFLDVKLGRQILTWGTGDLIFVNDLFPKDFRAFFIGRDDEYLKAPSDAVRLSAFFDLVNVDLAWTPRFDADRAIDGSRLSFFNPLLGRQSGEDAVLQTRLPDAWGKDAEVALRLYRNLGAYEAALYLYDGFWKSPAGFTADGRALHPALRVYGASLRGPLRGGIFNVEVGQYDSRDDRSGLDPFVQNGESRVLLGYEREVASELTLAMQYFAQHTADYAALRETLPAGFRVPDEIRHTLTVRLTRRALNQNLTLSLFNFWSPNDDDGHLRLRGQYKLTDAWRLEAGANLFYGPGVQTFFAQLDGNSNVFLGARRSF